MKKLILLLILFSLLLAGSVSATFICPGGWSYQIPITSNSSNSTNLTLGMQPIRIIINDTIMNYSKSQATLSDWRFINSSGNYLDFWFEHINTSGDTKVWVEVPVFTNNTNNTVYLCYGNSSVTNYSNMSNTFSIYHEDFENNSIAGWSAEAGLATSLSSSFAKEGAYGLKFISDSSGTNQLNSQQWGSLNNNFIVEYDIYFYTTNSTAQTYFGLGMDTDYSNSLFLRDGYNGAVAHASSIAWYDGAYYRLGWVDGIFPTGRWYKMITRVRANAAASQFDMSYIDSLTPSTTTFLNSSMNDRGTMARNATRYFYLSGQGNGSVYVDNLFVYYDYGSPAFSFGAEEGPASSFTLTWNYPYNNTQFNTPNLTFPITINSSNVLPVDCNLYSNGAINQTSAAIPTNSSVNITVNYSLTTQSQFNYSINCSNGAYSVSSNETRIVYIDNVNPSIVSNISNNNTYIIFDNFSVQINVSDSFLYSLNITTDAGYSNYTNLSGLTTYSWEGKINTSTYPVGTREVRAKVCDGHTSESIESYVNEKDSLTKSLTYYFDKDYVRIYPESAEDYSYVNTNKLTDRYSFEYNLKNPDNKKVYSFIVESSKTIDIINKTNYKGWLVIPSIDKWMDFELPNSKDLFYNTERISSTKVRIKIAGITQNILTFSSIGDLNCVWLNSTFHKLNYTITNTPSIIYELTDVVFNLTFDWGNITDFSSFFAWVNLNGTIYNATNSSNHSFYSTIIIPNLTADGNFTVNWIIQPINVTGNLTGDIFNATNTSLPGYNLTVWRINITPCSGSEIVLFVSFKRLNVLLK